MDSGTGLLGNFLHSSLGEHRDLRPPHPVHEGSHPTLTLGVPPAYVVEHKSLTLPQVPGYLLQSWPRVSSFPTETSLGPCKGQKYPCYCINFHHPPLPFLLLFP